MNPHIKPGYENCNVCPKEYCVKSHTIGSTLFNGDGVVIAPPCSTKVDSLEFTMWLRSDKLANNIGNKISLDSLLSCINYTIDNYTKLTFRDCLDLMKIKAQCNEWNELNGGVAAKASSQKSAIAMKRT